MLTTTLAILALLQTPTLTATPQVTTGITYRTVASTDLKADLYQPVKPLADPAPFVIVIHGGAWTSGKKEDMATFCQGLADQGIAAATISYRLSPKHKWPAHIEDVQAAIRYFRANAQKYKLDINNFGISGASAGGHLAMLAAYSQPWEKAPKDNPTTPINVNCVFNIFGPVDLTKDFNVAIAGMTTQQVLGIPYDPVNKDIINLGPINHITKSSPPTYTIHGETDPLVPVQQAKRLDQALKAAGVPHTLKIIPNMGHTIDVGNEECVKAIAEAVTFLKSHLNKTQL